MTGGAGMVTGGDAGGAVSPAGGGGRSGAERTRAWRARRQAAAEAARRLAASDTERAAEARQVGLPLGPAGEVLEPLEVGVVGRPHGSLAKRTALMRDKLLATYRSPLVVLAEIYARPVQELRRELGCTMLEAIRLQLDAARDLAPYLHSKMPTAVQLEGAAVAPILVGVSEAQAQVIVGEQGPGFRLPRVLEHQEVSEVSDE